MTRDKPTLADNVGDEWPSSHAFNCAGRYGGPCTAGCDVDYEDETDDLRLIDEAWLKSKGARRPHGHDHIQASAMTLPGLDYGVLVRTIDGYWNWCRNNRVIATIKTRGQFLHLLKGLKGEG